LGEQLLKFAETCRSASELQEKQQLWSDYTTELLKSLFTNEEVPREFGTMWGAWDRDPSRHLLNLHRGTQELLKQLRSIFGRIELFEEASGASTSRSTPPVEERFAARPASQEVFIVHGRDEAAKLTVARFLEKLDLHPTILHEQADKGRTIIQKFEDHSDVGFAVVLLTPDDEGRVHGSPELEHRARQNVILELGYFIGKLGRERVCALKVDGVEVPSDLHGVVYIPLDARGAWKLILARELKAAGIDVDMNHAL
jgi:hypothetical protein